ncbi:MAG TPA: hypothetical protein VKD90_21490 [Gemmataceae bacterium]|nr:hypothetical protein [Gemmataceae bacterium]
MGIRRKRKDRILAGQQQSRMENGHLKRAERDRRDERLRTLVKNGKLPFTPPVMSWLSAKLDKPGRLITQADVDKFLKG